MSLWLESLLGSLSDIGGGYGVDPKASPSVQRQQALCIVRYLAMQVPRSWWETALQTGTPDQSYANILHDLCLQLQKLPELRERVDDGLLVALPFIFDSGERHTEELPLEDHLLRAGKILAKRPDLQRLGETIAKMTALPYGLLRCGNRVYYADTYGVYVLQLEPSPAAWAKSRHDTKWKRTRNLPLELRYLVLGRLHQNPSTEVDLPGCSLIRWTVSQGEFSYEPDWNDSLPMKEWKKRYDEAHVLELLSCSDSDQSEQSQLPPPFNVPRGDGEEKYDWAGLLDDFFTSVPGPLLTRLKQFPAGSWALLEAAYQWEGFQDLMAAVPALAVCLALRVRVGSRQGVRRKRLDYANLVRCRQREIASAIGFGDSEAVVSILKKIQPDACTPRDLSVIGQLIKDARTFPHLLNAQQISGPAIFILDDEMLRGKLGGDLITYLSREFPLTDDILCAAKGTELLRGGSKARPFYDLHLGIRDLVRFSPDIVIQSFEDYQARHARMVKKLNEGAVSRSSAQFPTPPFPGTEHIQPITTAKELAVEGKEMQHCVKSYLRDILKWFTAVYRVTFPERATLSLERGPHAWYLGQLKLRNNEEPSEETVAFVHTWLKSNGIRLKRMEKRTRAQNVIAAPTVPDEVSSPEHKGRPKMGKYKEGPVNVGREHFRISYEQTPIALVARGGEEGEFEVQFQLDAVAPESLEEVDRGLRAELDFYLVDKPERNRWAYMIYHCGTFANAYAEYRWAYSPATDFQEGNGGTAK